MPKLVEFPKDSCLKTWGEAMQWFIDTADEETKNLVIRNMVIVTDTREEWNMGLLNGDEVRSLVGSMQCASLYLTDLLSQAIGD